MKRSSNQQSIGEAITDFLKRFRIDVKLAEVSAVASWEKLMGVTVAKRTKEIVIKNKTLYLKIESSALKDELSYSKEKIKDLINKEAGMVVVENVDIR
ncbi:MAG: DUF721 domain-containing protein [Bacteroidetes bacterium]|nr:DUF721 domain-containing protein [Bacteroidota bacterium]HET6244940.1 DUF721 domain-containing protein [Bacteroidia bacterium]